MVNSGLLAGPAVEDARRSLLNGQIINGVTLNSVLQGVAGPSQQTGSLFAELAYAPSFAADEPLPLRIPRGSMLSDATGYLSPNPYTDDPSAPRQVTLFMDVSMNTEEAQPNAGLSQDLLGVELTGIAIVDNGVLTIDAIGVVEPELLGQEYTHSTIAFRIEAATDADSVLHAAELWMPGSPDAMTGPAVDHDTGRIGVGVLLYPALLATTSADVYLQIPLLGQQKSITKPQILRMRYAKDDPDCTSNCSRSSLIPGIIVEHDNGNPVFKTKVDLFLDAPNL
ncbi:hypothetical protein BKP64_12805 [Marinobacter salinus]|uniref:Uncharacterized protein n=1 Tax=Marinobacter salinus TaxID=1874317 RepID=A0A1D9GMV9_9GAMM|nr:hypothetical protein [Marinobacter salinus]AOY88972.1 hypothetical protein BKP64_12805 [Marinobacter salinus]